MNEKYYQEYTEIDEQFLKSLNDSIESEVKARGRARIEGLNAISTESNKVKDLLKTIPWYSFVKRSRLKRYRIVIHNMIYVLPDIRNADYHLSELHSKYVIKLGDKLYLEKFRYDEYKTLMETDREHPMVYIEKLLKNISNNIRNSCKVGDLIDWEFEIGVNES
jgi:hypothetical protein